MLSQCEVASSVCGMRSQCGVASSVCGMLSQCEVASGMLRLLVECYHCLWNVTIACGMLRLLVEDEHKTRRSETSTKRRQIRKAIRRRHEAKRPRLHIYTYIAMWKSHEAKGEAKRGRSEDKNEKRHEDEWAVLN